MRFVSRQLNRVLKFSRKSKVLIQLVTDVLVFSSSFIFALLLQGESLQLIANPIILLSMIISIASGIVAFAIFGLYQSLVRFITGHVLMIVAKGVLVSSCFLALFFVILDVNIPLTVPLNYALLLFLITGVIRFQIRRLFRNSYEKSRKPAVIYGAGAAGRELQNTLFHNNEIRPVAFIDDDPDMQSMTIGDCSVYPISSFTNGVKKYEVELVLLALPNISRQRRRQIVDAFQGQGVELKTIPTMSNILSGEALVSDLRPVTPEMLLGRDPVASIDCLLQRNTTGASVLVTGAGGSIGAELCKQILAQRPSKIILFEISEFALFQINDDLLKAIKLIKSETSIVPVIGSVRDEKLVAKTINTHGVDTIYHAAAYKHVPLVEQNVVEAINNNVLGTLTMVRTAAELGVENFTLISTDKAVRPTNVMGASKRVAELICQAYAAEETKTKFCMVRFGNVLGSSGSVIPHFQKQIEAGGPVTITHPEITRYFMTIREASQLVIQAGAMSLGGDVFVLDMGEPVKIFDLATDMIRLNGWEPYLVDQTDEVLPKSGYIPICFTGLRKGEKIYEELLISNDPQATEHIRIFRAAEVSMPMADLSRQLALLFEACNAYDVSAVCSILKEMPLNFTHNEADPSNVVWNRLEIEANLKRTDPLKVLEN
jgi:FlaA1/EpsC-like NDP-sugar epimerase